MRSSIPAADASHGFAPIAAADARLLILGSLPSQRSLQADQYYAHPRNAFWPIMHSVIGAEGDYRRRCAALRAAGIAVWDVLAAAVRPGSLDADIRSDALEPNDFRGFLDAHPHVRCILFNGRKAETLFRRLVLPALKDDELELGLLPSTSPAHAAMPFSQKLEIWRSMIGPLAQPTQGVT